MQEVISSDDKPLITYTFALDPPQQLTLVWVYKSSKSSNSSITQSMDEKSPKALQASTHSVYSRKHN